MEFLKISYKRGVHLADALYIAANIVFVTLLVLVIFVWQLPVLALVLAALSKWRILAVRPRYWGINLRSNLVDLLFIVSVTSLAVNPLAEVAAQIAWLTVLAVWLLVVKRLSSQTMMLVQAAATQVVGVTALLQYTAFITINQLFMLAVVAGAWLIAYATARHALSTYDSEPKTEFFALLWGFIAAQLTWLFAHWLQVYGLAPGFVIPQVALVLLLLSFCAQRAYGLQRQIRVAEDARMRKAATKRELRSTYMAAGFSVSLIIVILLTTNWTITI